MLIDAGTYEIRGRSYQPEPIAVGDELRLVADPGNPVDPNAVRLIRRITGQPCGFIPRELAPLVSALLRGGFDLRGRVSGDASFTLVVFTK